MITYSQKKKFLNYAKKISRIHIPTWNELPEVDLYMDQVIIYIESHIVDFVSKDSKFITKSMVNNYVKQNILPAPVNKKYSKTHLAHLIIICLLKQIMPLPDVKTIIDSKLAKESIEDTYNKLGILYKKAVSAIVGFTKKAYKNQDFTELEDFNIFMTLGANSAKLIIEELLKESNNENSRTIANIKQK